MLIINTFTSAHSGRKREAIRTGEREVQLSIRVTRERNSVEPFFATIQFANKDFLAVEASEEWEKFQSATLINRLQSHAEAVLCQFSIGLAQHPSRAHPINSINFFHDAVAENSFSRNQFGFTQKCCFKVGSEQKGMFRHSNAYNRRIIQSST